MDDEKIVYFTDDYGQNFLEETMCKDAKDLLRKFSLHHQTQAVELTPEYVKKFMNSNSKIKDPMEKNRKSDNNSQKEETLKKYEWSRLSPLQVGRYAEYYAKMEFTIVGFDVYTSEVDDRGIDFIIRKDEFNYYDIQVKSVRGMNCIFFEKDKFNPKKNLLALIIIFNEGKPPDVYLIPSKKWLESNKLLVSRDYKGKKSKPEWGLNISKKNLPLLDEFIFSKIVKKL